MKSCRNTRNVVEYLVAYVWRRFDALARGECFISQRLWQLFSVLLTGLRLNCVPKVSPPRLPHTNPVTKIVVGAFERELAIYSRSTGNLLAISSVYIVYIAWNRSWICLHYLVSACSWLCDLCLNNAVFAWLHDSKFNVGHCRVFAFEVRRIYCMNTRIYYVSNVINIYLARCL